MAEKTVTRANLCEAVYQKTTARSSRSCRTGSIAPSPNRTRRTRPRSGTPTSADVATTTEQLPDDRVPREARKRRHAKKSCG